MFCLQGVSPRCGNPVGRGLSQAEKNEVVSMHNKLRSKVANGLEKRGSNGPQPSASDMSELVWDDEVCNNKLIRGWLDLLPAFFPKKLLKSLVDCNI